MRSELIDGCIRFPLEAKFIGVKQIGGVNLVFSQNRRMIAFLGISFGEAIAFCFSFSSEYVRGRTVRKRLLEPKKLSMASYAQREALR